MINENTDRLPAGPDRDKEVFVELHTLAIKRYKERAIGDLEKRFAGVPPVMLQKLKAAIGVFDQVGFQLSAQLGIDPHKVDYCSIARLQKSGLLTPAEITRFSAEGQEKIKQFAASPESDPPRRGMG